MRIRFLSIVSILLFGFSITLAQAPKMVSGGVVNGKAKNLVKPAYPSAAKAVNAEGAVSVQIVIDEQGNVASAKAVSGHPLLRQAAEQAALQSTFAPTMLNGQPVMVTGVVVYNFVADRATGWFKIGFDLAVIERGLPLTMMNVDGISKAFPAEWAAEKQQLDRLTEIKRAEEINNPPIVSSERKVIENTEKRADGTTVKTIITERAVKPVSPPNAEQTAIAQNLIAALQARLGSDEASLWQFNLGINLNKALSQTGNFNERQNTSALLRQQIQFAPSKIAPEYLADAQKVVTILENQNLTEEDRQQIAQIMPRLWRN